MNKKLKTILIYLYLYLEHFTLSKKTINKKIIKYVRLAHFLQSNFHACRKSSR